MGIILKSPLSRNPSRTNGELQNSFGSSNKSLPVSYCGHYDWNIKTKGTKFPSCHRQLKFEPLKNENPGPGSYSYKNFTFGSSGLHPTLKSKIELKDSKASIPGPGSYESLASKYSMSQNKSSIDLNSRCNRQQMNGKLPNRKNDINRPQPNPTSYSPNSQLVFPAAAR